MWLFCKEGFFSCVQDRYCSGDEVMVRSRLREDIEKLAYQVGVCASGIKEIPEADYAFRLKLKKQDWADYLWRSALAVDYPNFKATCATGRRAQAYNEVWAVMQTLQEENR